MKPASDAPPIHSQMLDLEIIEEDFDSYTPRPITSGPTQYSSHGLLSTLVWGYMVIQFFAKILIAGSFLTTNCLGCQGCHFCLVQFFSYLILAFNLWPLGFLCYKQHLTLDRFKLSEAGFCNWGALFFQIDCLWMATISFCGIGAGYRSAVHIIVIPSSLLIISNIIVLLIVINYDVDCYDPSHGTHKYVLLRKYEECPFSIKPLTIKESGPFRIVIQNCGISNWEGPLIVTRQIFWMNRSVEGGVNNFSENVEFVVDLKKPLSIGEFLTLIPETHAEEGSYRVKFHRSFGMEKAETVVTSVFNRKHLCIVRLIEEFKKDKLRAKQLKNIEEEDDENDNVVHS